MSVKQINILLMGNQGRVLEGTISLKQIQDVLLDELECIVELMNDASMVAGAKAMCMAAGISEEAIRQRIHHARMLKRTALMVKKVFG